MVAHEFLCTSSMVVCRRQLRIETYGLVVIHHCSSEVAHLTLRYTNRFEMEYLLDLCGFELLALYGDFDGRDYPGYGEQIWVAERS